MISIIITQAQENPELLWKGIIENKNRLQNAFGNKGRLLYLSRRRNYNEANLSVHVADPNILGEFIAHNLAKLQEVTSLWVVNMLQPSFFPLPKDTRHMKRYIITLKIFPGRLDEVYAKISNPDFPEWIKLIYVSYTFHLFNDCIQVSLLSEKEDVELRKYINDTIDKIPGVLKSTVFEIEKTHPFISYKEWQEYASHHPFLVDSDERDMIAHFNES
jgi:hypothetical protein